MNEYGNLMCGGGVKALVYVSFEIKYSKKVMIKVNHIDKKRSGEENF